MKPSEALAKNSLIAQCVIGISVTSLILTEQFGDTFSIFPLRILNTKVPGIFLTMLESGKNLLVSIINNIDLHYWFKLIRVAEEKKEQYRINSANWRARDFRKAKWASVQFTAKVKIERNLRLAGEFSEEGLKKFLEEKITKWDLEN